MIIENGHIEVKHKKAGGIDDNGMPVPPTFSFGKPIRCQWWANSFSWRGRTSSGGHFTSASFEILVEAGDGVELGEQLRLTDDRGRTIGEFSVMSIEPLQAVGQYRILV